MKIKGSYYDYVTPARLIRNIVSSKESFVWPTTMSEIKIIFGVTGLGSDIVHNILNALDAEGIGCFSGNNRPTQAGMPILLFLKTSRHSQILPQILCEHDEPQVGNGHVSQLPDLVAG